MPPKGSKFCNQCGTSFPFRDCEDKDSVDVKFLKAMSVDLCFSLTEKQQLIVHSARPFPERGRVPSVFVFILGRLGARSLQATSVPSCKEYLTIVSSAECAGQILVHRFPARAQILVHRSTAISRQLARKNEGWRMKDEGSIKAALSDSQAATACNRWTQQIFA